MMSSHAVLMTQWATCEEDVRAAQRLRYQVFAQEMGAHIIPLAGTPPDHDADRFDPFCDHLLVRLCEPGDDNGLLIGTYRMLSPGAAERAGGYYTETEFDLAPLAALRGQAVELGRSCVHADWRSGAVIMALWTALGQYMIERDLDTMIGCASIGLTDRGETARSVWHALRQTHLVDAQWRIQPHVGLPPTPEVAATRHNVWRDAPPLVKGYLRCGARVLGPPAHDANFNTADLPLMLRLDDVTPRYRKHFFSGALTNAA